MKLSNNIKILILKKYYEEYNKAIITKEIRSKLKTLQDSFVITVVDKASQNLAFICKKFYISQICKEIGLNENIHLSKTYEQHNICVDEIISNFSTNCLDFQTEIPDICKNLPFIQIIPKFHKKPVKFRTIISSSKAFTKPLSRKLCLALKLIQKRMQGYCKTIETYTKINPFWIIDNNKEILDIINATNNNRNCRNINTFDFTTLYTTLKHDEILENFQNLFKKAFGKSNNKRIKIDNYNACWHYSNKYSSHTIVDQKDLLNMLRLLITNTYFFFW